MPTTHPRQAYTRRDAEAAFKRLAKALNKPLGDELPYSTIGAWILDHNGIYGGYVIEEYVTDGGGVRQPFGPRRRSAREFCDAVNFALDAIRAKEGK